jgi:hypothetical protein
MNWFTQNGDKVFTFISLTSLALGGIAGLSPAVVQAALIAGVVATAAHQSFFPNPPRSIP